MVVGDDRVVEDDGAIRSGSDFHRLLIQIVKLSLRLAVELLQAVEGMDGLAAAGLRRRFHLQEAVAEADLVARLELAFRDALPLEERAVAALHVLDDDIAAFYEQLGMVVGGGLVRRRDDPCRGGITPDGDLLMDVLRRHFLQDVAIEFKMYDEFFGAEH